jgi:hypothetical protein
VEKERNAREEADARATVHASPAPQILGGLLISSREEA